jgi:ring-1,2-phenylacetyl-CoA epoxidase subunit PaaC
MFDPDETDTVLAEEGIGCVLRALEPAWREAVGNVFDEATLTLPSGTWMQRGGKNGVHTEHLGHMLATMQWMQRTHPGAQW